MHMMAVFGGGLRVFTPCLAWGAALWCMQVVLEVGPLANNHVA